MQPDLLRSNADPTVSIDPAEVGRIVEGIFPEALGVWVYGSFADGRARPDSDLDIGVLAARPLPTQWDLLDRIGEIGSRLGRTIDLVDLRRVPPLLRFEIFSSGLRVAARDPRACDFYETTSISAYQRLNVERRDLLESIWARGSIY